VNDAAFESRESTGSAPDDEAWSGTGRELFAAFRRSVGSAEHGASVIQPDPTEFVRCAS
jgi:phosphogluconate dehydratase